MCFCTYHLQTKLFRYQKGQGDSVYHKPMIFFTCGETRLTRSVAGGIYRSEKHVKMDPNLPSKRQYAHKHPEESTAFRTSDDLLADFCVSRRLAVGNEAGTQQKHKNMRYTEPRMQIGWMHFEL